MAFARKERQRIIDNYLNESGHNRFVPAEFLDWLSARPDHEVYDVFFGMSDEDAARAHRIDMVRQWTSGLRVTVNLSEQSAVKVGSVTVREVSLPAMVSPLSGRKGGGGYIPVDEDALPELRLQAAQSLGSWLERYSGVLMLSGISVDPIKEIVRKLEAADVVEAA